MCTVFVIAKHLMLFVNTAVSFEVATLELDQSVYSVSRKKETKMFLVISSIKLGQF